MNPAVLCWLLWKKDAYPKAGIRAIWGLWKTKTKRNTDRTIDGLPCTCVQPGTEILFIS